jgi:hypothetical protein
MRATGLAVDDVQMLVNSREGSFLISAKSADATTDARDASVVAMARIEKLKGAAAE